MNMKIISIISLKVFALFIFLSCFSPNTFAQNEKNIFESANQNYKEGKYGKAIQDYEHLVNNNYEGTSLYYNLGNTYYRMGQIGKAILNYERALKLSPGDEDVLHNLAFVNLKIADKIESLPKFFLFQWWENLLVLFSLSGWSYFALIIFILILGCVVAYFFAKKIEVQKISFFSGLVLASLLLLTALIITVNLNRELNWKFGIVMTTSLTVKTSPDLQSKDSFIIHEGLKIKVEDQLEEWYKIKLDDGKIGWVSKNDLEII